MKYDNIPPIKGSPNIKKAIEGKASPARKRGRRSPRTTFTNHNRDLLKEMCREDGVSQGAWLSSQIAREYRKRSHRRHTQ